jgi:hypothetical protein
MRSATARVREDDASTPPRSCAVLLSKHGRHGRFQPYPIVPVPSARGKSGYWRPRIPSRAVPLGSGDRRKQNIYSAIIRGCQDFYDGHNTVTARVVSCPVDVRIARTSHQRLNADAASIAVVFSWVTHRYSSIASTLTRSTVSRTYPSRLATISRRIVATSSSLENTTTLSFESTDFI